jgi:hypothetical protein
MVIEMSEDILIEIEQDSLSSDILLESFNIHIDIYGKCIYFHDDEFYRIGKRLISSKDINTFAKISVSVTCWLVNNTNLYHECNYEDNPTTLEMNSYGSYLVKEARTNIRGFIDNEGRIRMPKLKNQKAITLLKLLARYLSCNSILSLL